MIDCQLARDVSKLIEEFGFSVYTDLEKGKPPRKLQRRIRISGKDMLDKWIDIIGFNNQYHMIKYRILKKFGYCPPKLNILQLKEFYSRGVVG